MKKTYMTPEMEVMNIETVEMIASSPNPTLGLNEGEVDADNEQNVNDRRGTWGNLWN